MASIKSVLIKNGFALKSDLDSIELKSIYNKLKKEQDSFLKDHIFFRSQNYKWAFDALHWWSRIWEYPFVYKNLKQLLKKNKNLKVLDFGSGTTFFPFTLSKLGCNVICVDNDKVCVNDLEKAIKHFKKGKQIKSVLSIDYSIPLKSNSIDLIYSVSVIEHIIEYEKSILELHRLLKKSGYLILTFDVCLLGNAELNRNNYLKLIDVLIKYFELTLPETKENKNEYLTTINSLIPYPHKFIFRHLLYNIKRIIIDIVSLRVPKCYFVNDVLAVKGLVLKVKK